MKYIDFSGGFRYTWGVKNEIKMDGRVSFETLLEKRKQVINFYKKGMKIKEIFEARGE